MRRISALVDHELVWYQLEGLRQEFELRFGDEVIGTLKLPKMLSSAAEFHCEEGTWAIERVGFMSARTVVRAVGSAEAAGTYTARMWRGGGTIELSGQRKLGLRSNMWQREFELCTEAGESLVHMKGRGFLRYKVDVQLTREATKWPELHWLVALLFYQILMLRRDSAAHSAVH